MKSITEMLIPPAFSVRLDFQPAKIRIDSIKIKKNKSINSATKFPTGNGRTRGERKIVHVQSVKMKYRHQYFCFFGKELSILNFAISDLGPVTNESSGHFTFTNF